VPDNHFALLLDGVNDRVEVTKTDSLRLTSGTVSAWFKTSHGGTEQVILADERLNGTQVIWSYRLRVNPAGHLAFDFTTDNRAYWPQVSCSPLVNNGLWHHAAAVRNDVNSTVMLYLDGAQCGNPLSYSGNIDNSSNPLWIGNTPYNNGVFPFEGAIDDVRLYAAILSPSQVAALADGRDSGAAAWPPPTPTPTPPSWTRWRGAGSFWPPREPPRSTSGWKMSPCKGGSPLGTAAASSARPTLPCPE